MKEGIKSGGRRRELISDWVSNNDDSVRSLPIYVGGISLLAVLFNRTLSGIAPVADASSSQSRADLLTIGLAVTNILAGLVWLSIRPKSISVVPPRGVECERYTSSNEGGKPTVVDSSQLMQGSIYQGVVMSGSHSYLENLSLYPRKSQLPFLPSNIQAVILQPLGDKGIAILGGDTIRGFTTSDQAWITLIGEKLDATLSKHMISVPLSR
ncbi:protein cofactor assembly of complex C subunit B CCB4, chloroplastic isoform X1 [Tanacetum coccineum]